ncbi:unnamed protein product [Orchesella dallaii]|uniref:MADF domain-containing protein n=1 Tax=Orchesella dallaii TaxID=48710 RepID=A0ABP1QIP7_9HEXA
MVGRMGKSKSRASNVKIDEEILINLVSEHPYLYDKKHEDFMDKIKKANAWTSIGEKLLCNGDTVSGKWENLRKQYTDYLRKSKLPTGSGGKRKVFYRFAEQMRFYEDCYKPYTAVSNVTLDEPDVDQVELTSGDIDDEMAERVVNPVIDPLTENVKSTPTEAVGYKPPPKKNKVDQLNVDAKLVKALESCSASKMDKFEAFGATVCASLSEIHEKHPKKAAKLMIDIQTIIFDAQYSEN